MFKSKCVFTSLSFLNHQLVGQDCPIWNIWLYGLFWQIFVWFHGSSSGNAGHSWKFVYFENGATSCFVDFLKSKISTILGLSSAKDISEVLEFHKDSFEPNIANFHCKKCLGHFVTSGRRQTEWMAWRNFRFNVLPDKSVILVN